MRVYSNLALKKNRPGKTPPTAGYSGRLTSLRKINMGAARGTALVAQAKRCHPPCVRVRQLREHPANLAQLADLAAREQAGQRLPLRGHPLRLAERLADQPPCPQRQPARHPGVDLDGLADPGHHESGVPGVLEHLQYEVPRPGVEQLRHGTVEIGGYAVSDIG